jgi:hypothetical protein
MAHRASLDPDWAATTIGTVSLSAAPEMIEKIVDQYAGYGNIEPEPIG